MKLLFTILLMLPVLAIAQVKERPGALLSEIKTYAAKSGQSFSKGDTIKYVGDKYVIKGINRYSMGSDVTEVYARTNEGYYFSLDQPAWDTTLQKRLALMQGIPELPMKDSVVFYEEKVDVPGANSALIYQQAKLYVIRAFKSANAVIQMDDKDAGKIVGKGFAEFAVDVKHGLGTEIFTYRCHFILDISVKEGKYRAQIYDLSMEMNSYLRGFNPAGVPLDYVKQSKMKGKTQRETGIGVLQNVNSICLTTLSELKDAIAKGVVQTKDNW